MSSPPALRLLAIGLTFCVAAAAIYGGLRATFGHRPVFVHVRWNSSVGDAERQRLEQRYGLAPIELEEGTTFSYALRDTRTENVKSLVLNPVVDDTHNIHRTAFRGGYFAPRLPYLTSNPRIPAGLEVLTVLCLICGLVSIGLAGLAGAAPRLLRGPAFTATNVFLDPKTAGRTTAASIAAWIAHRIPDASAEAVAVFRVTFGALLLNLVLRRPVSASMAADPSNVLAPTHEFMLRPFVAAPWIAEWLPAWVLLSGLLFIVGVFSRVAFAALTLGVLAWATLYTTATSYHTVCALLLTLLALQGSRWSDAWSLDAWRRGSPRKRVTPKQYGFVTWVPGLVLGVVYFAAAFAKLRDTGLAWILNGTVKYHFLSDSPAAVVDWGLQVGHHPTLAVALSFGAIALESFVLVGVLVGAYRYRLGAGLASLSLLTGFLLFQGLLWTAWWILLLSFLPWHLLWPVASTTGAASLAEAQANPPPLAIALVVALIAQQIVVSLLRLEASPVLSTYDMYSTTYASPSDYEHNAGQVYWIVGLDRAVEQHRCRISSADASLMERDGLEGQRPLTQVLIRDCFGQPVEVEQIMVEATRVQVDWEKWRLLDEPLRTRVTGPIPIDRLY